MKVEIRGTDEWGEEVREIVETLEPRPWPWYRHVAIRIANALYPNLAYRLGLTKC